MADSNGWQINLFSFIRFFHSHFSISLYSALPDCRFIYSRSDKLISAWQSSALGLVDGFKCTWSHVSNLLGKQELISFHSPSLFSVTKPVKQIGWWWSCFLIKISPKNWKFHWSFHLKCQSGRAFASASAECVCVCVSSAVKVGISGSRLYSSAGFVIWCWLAPLHMFAWAWRKRVKELGIWLASRFSIVFNLSWAEVTKWSC